MRQPYGARSGRCSTAGLSRLKAPSDLEGVAMQRTPHEQAFVAHRWMQEGLDRNWTDFARYWMAFNGLYNCVRKEGKPEVQAVGKVISAFFDESKAQTCLDEIRSEDISALTAVPP